MTNEKTCVICGKPIEGFWDTLKFATGDVYICTDCRAVDIAKLELCIDDETKLSIDSDDPEDENSGVFETTATVLDAVADDLVKDE